MISAQVRLVPLDKLRQHGGLVCGLALFFVLLPQGENCLGFNPRNGGNARDVGLELIVCLV